MGYPCLSLHGGKDQSDRESTISDFKSDVCNVLVATGVAARGLDVKDLVLVVNFDPPNHHEEYVHRVGRTGAHSFVEVGLGDTNLMDFHLPSTTRSMCTAWGALVRPTLLISGQGIHLTCPSRHEEHVHCVGRTDAPTPSECGLGCAFLVECICVTPMLCLP